MNYKLTELESRQQDGLRFIVHYFNTYKWALAGMFSLLFVSTLGSTTIPKLTEYAINHFVLAGDIQKLWWATLIGLAIVIVSTLIQYWQTIITGTVSQKVLYDVRRDIFAKLQELPVSFYSQNQSGEIIQRITENVSDIDRFFQEGFLRFMNLFFSIVLIFVFMFATHWQATLISLLGVVSLLFFLVLQSQFLHRLNKKYLALDSNLTAFDKETLDGHKVILSYNQQQVWYETFTHKNQHYLNFVKKMLLVSVTSEGFLAFVSNIVTLLTLFYTLTLYAHGQMLAGTVMVFVSYSFSVFKKMNGVSQIWMNVQKGLVAAERLHQILNLKSTIQAVSDGYDPEPSKVAGSVEFKDVLFHYDDDTQPALKDFNLRVAAGQSVAVVGPTGAGKTTFVNLIARLYDVSQGEVLVDGVNVKQWNLQKLRSKIGYLIQDTFLFEDTIYHNLTYNNPQVTREQAIKIFSLLGAAKFLKDLPSGLDTIVDPNGQNMSAGQRQIIALARVLLRDPKVLILDEATAKIDTQSEKMVQTAIEKSTKNITSFIIAHRLSTIFQSDLIIVINNNTVVEAGTHQELLAKKGAYAEMYARFVR